MQKRMSEVTAYLTEELTVLMSKLLYEKYLSVMQGYDPEEFCQASNLLIDHIAS